MCTVECNNKPFEEDVEYQWYDGDRMLEGETESELAKNLVSFESKQEYKCEVVYKASTWDSEVEPVKIMSESLTKCKRK